MHDTPFRFDARLVDDCAVWPQPSVSSDAKVLLGALLNHAIASSSDLVRRDHSITVEVGDFDRMQVLIAELMLVKFAMPVENGAHPIPTLESFSWELGARHHVLNYIVDDTYAAYLFSLGLSKKPMVVGSSLLLLDPQEQATVRAALQLLEEHRQKAYNFQLIEALRDKREPLSPVTYGVGAPVLILRRMGALPGGGGFY